MRLTIKLKLAATFAVVVVLSGVMAWLGINSLNSLETAIENMLAGPVEQTQVANDMETDMLQILRLEKSMIMTDAQEQIARHDADLVKYRAHFVERLQKYESTASADGKQVMSAIH